MILTVEQQKLVSAEGEDPSYVATAVSQGMPFELALQVVKAGGFCLQVHRATGRGMSFEDAMEAVKAKACTLDTFAAMQKGMTLSKAIGNMPYPKTLEKVARHILKNPQLLDMESAYSKENAAHCLAGWGIHFQGVDGEFTERKYGWEITARSILGCKAAEYFYRSNEEVIAFLKTVQQPALELA